MFRFSSEKYVLVLNCWLVVMKLNEGCNMSSCSTECDCYMCRVGMTCQYYEERTPFYPTMGEPCVYYCNVPNEINSEGKKPNCFVRAFRWYTEEHHPPLAPVPALDKWKWAGSSGSPDHAISPNIGGFAKWLDSKYEQYLMENVDNDACCIKVTQTNVLETCEPIKCKVQRSEPGETQPRKRFGRFKSPWRKNAQKPKDCTSATCPSADEKVIQSMEFIMPPKDTMSRVASVCCQPTQQSCASVGKCATKSHSVTHVYSAVETSGDERREPVPIDNPPVEKKPSLKRHKKKDKGSKPCKMFNNVSCQCYVDVVNKDLQTPSRVAFEIPSQEKVEKNKEAFGDVCHCTAPTTMDAGCQYECPVLEQPDNTAPIHGHETCLCCYCPDCQNRGIMRDTPNYTCDSVPVENYSYQNVVITMAPPPSPTSGKCDPTCPFLPRGVNKNSAPCQTDPSPSIQFAQDGAQTSDLSINLDTKTIRESHFFLKIICVDQENQERRYVI